MTASKTLLTYFERYALAGLEKRSKLDSLLEDHLHELDLDSGKIRFNAYEFPMQVMGTESENTLTWLWAWADEQTEIPSGLIHSAAQVRAWGEEQKIPEFTSPSVDIDIADGMMLSLVASEVCRASCYYSDHYAGGAVFLLLFDKIIDGLRPFDRAALVRGMADLFSRYEMNHRNALLSYATMKGLAPSDAGSTISFELESRERLVAEFDDNGRLIVVNGVPFEA